MSASTKYENGIGFGMLCLNSLRGLIKNQKIFQHPVRLQDRYHLGISYSLSEVEVPKAAYYGVEHGKSADISCIFVSVLYGLAVTYASSEVEYRAETFLYATMYVGIPEASYG